MALNVASLAEQLADPEVLKEFLASLTPEQTDELLHNWEFLARPEQIPPKGNHWSYWLYLAGRGSGKTRSGAEWIRQKVKDGAKWLGFIAPTQGDIRSVMVEGQSGIMACSYAKDVDCHGMAMGIPEYEPSLRHKLTWANGAVAQGYSAEEPDRLRGPQHEAIWCDEMAAWQYMRETWDMAMFGLRIGPHPQAMISTTPRPLPLLRELMRSPLTVVTRSSTDANAANLAPSFLSSIVAKYQGTRLGRQELDGILLEEMEGALWKRSDIDAALLPQFRQPPDFMRLVVAIDPAVTEKATSNLTGIVVAGLGADLKGYVLEDASGKFSPQGWAEKAIALYDGYKADAIVAEGNQGGDMVRHTLHTVRPNLPIRIVHATRSKQARAEPIASLYEQARVHHVRPFPEMEDQMCVWEPLSGDPSPDRLDALVWALTDLMLTSQVLSFPIPIVTGNQRLIPGQGAPAGTAYAPHLGGYVPIKSEN